MGGKKPLSSNLPVDQQLPADAGVFGATTILEIVKKHDSGSLVWKRIKLTITRKANAKKRLHKVWQNEAVLKACSEPAPANAPKKIVEKNTLKMD